jgi:hypothetical protein
MKDKIDKEGKYQLVNGQMTVQTRDSLDERKGERRKMEQGMLYRGLVQRDNQGGLLYWNRMLLKKMISVR